MFVCGLQMYLIRSIEIVRAYSDEISACLSSLEPGPVSRRDCSAMRRMTGRTRQRLEERMRVFDQQAARVSCQEGEAAFAMTRKLMVEAQTIIETDIFETFSMDE
ncbi:hypothetical protein WJX84_010146 [Apatococcus fuscideae]|uniref:Uncharacterized protein n=1 Tax=Apatococcus fuscideae TaxID=2026836 RepID=A0AAW1SYP8_9CHLO